MRCAAIARSAQASLRSKSLRRILVTAFVLATLSRAIAERDDRLGRITFRVFFSVIFVIFYFSKAVEYPVVKYRHDVWANVEIVEKAKLATRWYAPTFWGFNRHAQTVLLFALGHLEWVWSHLTWNHEAIDAVDGNTLDIFWAGTDEARAGGDELHAFRSASLPVVVLVPGIGGDAQSPYIKRMTRACAANGWRVALHAYWRLDFNNTADLNAVIERIAMENPSAPICAIAFSAGGHLLFKYLQEVGSETPLVAAVTVSGCFDLRGAIHNVKANENGAYELFLNKQLRLCVRRHIARDKRFKPTLDDNGDETAPAEMDPVEFARNVVGPSPPSGDAQSEYDRFLFYYGGYPGEEEYSDGGAGAWELEKQTAAAYETCAAKDMDRVGIPSLVLHADDDPIVSARFVDWAAALENKNLIVAHTKRGGHVSWYTGATPWGDDWACGMAVSFLSASIESTAQRKYIDQLVEERMRSGACTGRRRGYDTELRRTYI